MQISAEKIRALAEEIRSHLIINNTHTVGLSHCVTIISGLENKALGPLLAEYCYIAGFVRAIDLDLSLARELLGVDLDLSDQVKAGVVRILGKDNAVDKRYKEDYRNPWLTECLCHLALYLSRNVPELGPPGQLLVLSPIHVNAKQQGFDLTGIHHENGTLGLCIAETKASKNNPANLVREAAGLFLEVDEGLRDAHIREAIQLLKFALHDTDRAKLTHTFWSSSRAYLPTISYQQGAAFAPGARRPSLGQLALPSTHIRLLCMPLSSYDSFFDNLSSEIRSAAEV